MIVVIDNFVREEKQMLLFPHLYFHDFDACQYQPVC